MDSTPQPPQGNANRARLSRRVRGLFALPLAALVLSGCSLPTFYGFKGVTTQSQSTYHLWQWFSLAAFIIGGFVLLLILYAVIRYRRKGDSIPKQVQYHIPLELLYTVIPIVIVFVLFAATVVVENKVTAEPKSSLTVNVNAFKWGWKFQYPQSNALVYGQTTQAPMFQIPVDTNVHFTLTSSDVVHGFYIREFDFSRYALPGITNTFNFTAVKTGTYFGQCSQLCGLYHTLMYFRVKVVSKSDFAAWVAQFNTKKGAARAEAGALATKQILSPGIPVIPATTTGQK